MKIIAIARSPRYSPNSVERDAAILHAVGDRLTQAGHSVAYHTEDALPDALEADVLLSMGRHARTLKFTQDKPCINTAGGIAHCQSRMALAQSMEAHGIPQPKAMVLELPAMADGIAQAQESLPLWVKRADGYSESTGDVTFVADAMALQTTLERFTAEGHKQVVLSEHLEGDLIKFYGVAGTSFFRYAYATAQGSFSKFGWEAQNGLPQYYAFDTQALQAKLHAFAEHIGTPIYGGDAIVGKDGCWHVIDFNDWPSFAAFRDEAAEAIVQRIIDNFLR